MRKRLLKLYGLTPGLPNLWMLLAGPIMGIMIFWGSLLGYPFRDSTSLSFLKLAASGGRDGDCFQPAADPTAFDFVLGGPGGLSINTYASIPFQPHI